MQGESAALRTASAHGDDAELEVVPLRLFALLAFPDGYLAPGAGLDRRLPLGIDVAARFSAGALVEARGTLIRWQPDKHNTVVALQRQ